MEYKNLGCSSLKIAPLMFGGNVFGWTADEKTSFSLLDAWLDAGFNAVDTADIYSRWVPGNQGGESEAILGKWLKMKGGRDKVIIATKLGKVMGEGMQGLSCAYIKKAVEASLKRLQTDYIDLYQTHEDDLNTPLEETMQALSDLVQEGKVRVLGASNYSAKRFEQALDVSEQLGIERFESIQPDYNLYDRQEFESAMQVLCMTKKVGVINYYALCSGFLTGKYRKLEDLNGRARGGKFTAEHFNERGQAILSALDVLAEQHQVTPAAITLAWEMAQDAIAAPIVSATSVVQLKELIQAVEVKLSDSDRAHLNQVSAY